MDDNIFDLTDRVILITGAAGLLGYQHADAIASAGGIPILLDLNEKKVRAQAKEFKKKYSCESAGYIVDITDEDKVYHNCRHIMEVYGKIDGLINNAANNPKVESNSTKNFSRLENFPLEIWEKDIAVGLTGAFICSKHYGNAIFKNNNGGVIINISSDLGLIAPDQRLYKKNGIDDDMQAVKPVTYSVVKSGLIGLTRYLSTYWPEKVRCNALCPGGIEAGQPEEFLKKVTSRIPMNRLAKVNEYQGIINFLLSDASSYMNGTILPMDGGA